MIFSFLYNKIFYSLKIFLIHVLTTQILFFSLIYLRYHHLFFCFNGNTSVYAGNVAQFHQVVIESTKTLTARTSVPVDFVTKYRTSLMIELPMAQMFTPLSMMMCRSMEMALPSWKVTRTPLPIASLRSRCTSPSVMERNAMPLTPKQFVAA